MTQTAFDPWALIMLLFRVVPCSMESTSPACPWHCYGVIQPQKAKGWKCRTITESSFPRSSSLWARGILFEQCGRSWGLTSPTQAIGTFPQAGSLQEVTALSCASQPDTVFVMGVVLKWILCICHQCRNTDLRVIINTCENPQLLVIFNNLFRFNLESNVK